MKYEESTHSKAGKSPAWKARKIAQHRENQALRATLHREKATMATCERRYEVQQRIDALSKKEK